MFVARHRCARSLWGRRTGTDVPCYKQTGTYVPYYEQDGHLPLFLVGHFNARHLLRTNQMGACVPYYKQSWTGDGSSP